MSYASDKGYRAEKAVCDYLAGIERNVRRPRLTSYQDTDTGDIAGLPFVVSIKDHARLALADFVDEMTKMVGRSSWATGIVVHKRRGRRDAGDWYVTLPLKLMAPFIRAYMTVVKDYASAIRERDSH